MILDFNSNFHEIIQIGNFTFSFARFTENICNILCLETDNPKEFGITFQNYGEYLVFSIVYGQHGMYFNYEDKMTICINDNKVIEILPGKRKSYISKVV